jgi:hypothetical protein
MLILKLGGHIEIDNCKITSKIFAKVLAEPPRDEVENESKKRKWIDLVKVY